MSAADVTPTDLRHLARCVALAEEAVDAGDEPFGSLLVDGAGAVLFEDRNRVGTGDATLHPELAVAQWAARHLPPADRPAATVYTSGEHCPMCSAAHAWVGLGRIVFATSAEQTGAWYAEFGAPPSPVRPLPVRVVAPGVPTAGPVDSLADRVRELHRRRFTRPVR